MNKNVGIIDRAIRLGIATVLILLFFTGVVGGVLGYVALGVAAIFIITGLVGTCPIYSLFGVKTCRTSNTV